MSSPVQRRRSLIGAKLFESTNGELCWEGTPVGPATHRRQVLEQLSPRHAEQQYLFPAA